jgi:hypothetical protein
MVSVNSIVWMILIAEMIDNYIDEDQEEIRMTWIDIRKLSCRAKNNVGESEDQTDP